MVQSGGAYGGHYYAYIKDLQTNKWYNFNDSAVREISILEVVEMFGVPPPQPGKRGMAARRTMGNNHANAYMLMYRIIN